MNPPFSNTVEKIQISGIRRFFNKVALYPDAISLTVGQPDFPVPAKIKHAMVQAIEGNATAYTSNIGIIELRTAISDFLKRDQLFYSPEEICITAGGSEAIFNVFMTLLNPGDKVLIPSIAYPAYESCVTLAGGQIIPYPLTEDFSIDFHALSVLLKKEKPQAMVLSFPSNPTGTVLKKEDLSQLELLLKDQECYLISDEMYGAILYDCDYYSIGQLPGLRSRTILVGGFSKIFSMTGLRIGYVCASEPILSNLVKVHQYNTTCAPSIVQWGAYAGLQHCLPEAEAMAREFQQRRDYVYARLKAMGMDVVLPQGAFYIFPSIQGYGLSSDDFCSRLLNEAGVAMVPGSAFGAGGEGYLRISYAYGMPQLEEGLNRLEKWLLQLPKTH